MFVQPDATAEELKNHPGTWFEIRTHIPIKREEDQSGTAEDTSPSAVEYMLSVNELLDFAHVCYRSLVFSSDHRFSLADLPIDTAARDGPAPPSEQYCSGQFFGSMFASPGRVSSSHSITKEFLDCTI